MSLEGNKPTAVEKGYQKYAWVIFLVNGLAFALAGLIEFFAPDSEASGDYALFASSNAWSQLQASNPQAVEFIHWLTQEWGGAQILGAVLVIAISLTAYRRGEKWAWYVMWMLPVAWGLTAYMIGSWGGGLLPLSLAFLVLSLIGLFLPYRKFFPRK